MLPCHSHYTKAHDYDPQNHDLILKIVSYSLASVQTVSYNLLLFYNNPLQM